jgi:hypothetical protein
MRHDNLAHSRAVFVSIILPWAAMLLPAAVTSIGAVLMVVAASLVMATKLPILVKLLEIWVTISLPAGLFVGHCILTGE